MTAITALLLGTFAAAPATYEQISMACHIAINRALSHVAASPPTGSTGGETNDAVEARYTQASCHMSTVVPGRAYVYLTPKGSFAYSHGPYYVVEPSGEITTQRDMPCEEHPSACE
ncbi:hypothetical protein [Tahibacter caeni]|uniref:hypothetical protein n=1 Tax=Tahibacter caeni TaxID=1453545 RepID=UPI0021489BEF|nr:hypothetical protein [Tahibacter caeni]